jgi:hypothetical protein
MDELYLEKELPLSPSTVRPARNSARTLAQVSVVTSACAFLIFATVFVILWGPVYLTGSEGNLFLYPLAFVALVPMFLLGLSGIVTGAIALTIPSATQRSSRLSRIGVAIGALLVILAVPVLWFGNAPLVFVGL